MVGGSVDSTASSNSSSGTLATRNTVSFLRFDILASVAAVSRVDFVPAAVRGSRSVLLPGLGSISFSSSPQRKSGFRIPTVLNQHLHGVLKLNAMRRLLPPVCRQVMRDQYEQGLFQDDFAGIFEGIYQLAWTSVRKFDLKTAKPMTAGSFMVMPKGVSHFAWTRGETILQVHAIGPWGLTYVIRRTTREISKSGGPPRTPGDGPRPVQ